MKLLILMAFVACPTIALADPCEAPVDHFQAGDTFSGTVRYVGDGDGLCVGRTSDPSEWIEVRLGDFNAPELSQPGGKRAKAILRQSLGQTVTCTAGGARGPRVVSYDRVVAICRVGSERLGDHLRRFGSPEGGN